MSGGTIILNCIHVLVPPVRLCSYSYGYGTVVDAQQIINSSHAGATITRIVVFAHVRPLIDKSDVCNGVVQNYA